MFRKLSYFIIKIHYFKVLIEVYFKILSVNFAFFLFFFFFLFSTGYKEIFHYKCFLCLINFAFYSKFTKFFLLTMIKFFKRNSNKILEYFIINIKKRGKSVNFFKFQKRRVFFPLRFGVECHSPKP